MSHVNAHTEFNKAEAGDALVKLDTLAEAYATDYKVDYHTAYGKVLETAEGSKLYTKARHADVPARTPAPMSKAVQGVIATNVTFEEIAKSAFPDLDAVGATVAYRKTDAGKRAYGDYLGEIANAKST